MPCGVSRALSVVYTAVPGVPARTDSLMLEQGPSNTSPTTSWEGPLHMVEATVTLRLWLHIQPLLWKRWQSQHVFSYLEAAACSGLLDGLPPASEGRVNLNSLDSSSADMYLSLGTTSFPAVMGSSCTRWWLQLGTLCHASSFAPAQVCPHSRYTSCLPQVKKSGYSWAMTGFGFVSRRTDPLEVCSLCCLCRLLPNALCPTTAVLKQSQLGHADTPPPPSAASCAV